MRPLNTRAQARPRADFPHFTSLSTRWMDNDAYGHLNNVVYYSLFDSAVNAYLMARGVLDPAHSPVIGLVVDTGCSYFKPLAFPQVVDAGIRVARLGRTSVRYELGLFATGEPLSAACGHFVHVYVDRDTREPTALPAPLRQALEPLYRPEAP